MYAFGVVLLELLIGRKPVEKMSPSQCQSIVTWVYNIINHIYTLNRDKKTRFHYKFFLNILFEQAMPQLTDRSKLPNIVDPVIRDTMDLKHLYQVSTILFLVYLFQISGILNFK